MGENTIKLIPIIYKMTSRNGKHFKIDEPFGFKRMKARVFYSIKMAEQPTINFFSGDIKILFIPTILSSGPINFFQPDYERDRP